MKKLTNHVNKGVLMGIFLLTFVLGGVKSADAYTFALNIRIGSSGTEVSKLQNLLNNGGYASPYLGVDGKFGPKTDSAVKNFQLAKGLIADGIVGPNTRVALNAFNPPSSAGTNLPTGCLPGYMYSPLTGLRCDGSQTVPNPLSGSNVNLSGDAGFINVTAKSIYKDEEIGEGAKDAPVLAFEVKADGSDVLLTSMRLEFIQSDADASDRLTRYVKSVSIWMDNKKIGEANASEFSESKDVWTKNISLDKTAVVKGGRKQTFSVAVTASINIDSVHMATDVWTVDVLGIRFQDGKNTVLNENTDDAGLEKNFDFTTFALANNVELQVSLDDEEVNESHLIDVSDTQDTKNVPILSFKLRTKGNSDIHISEIPVLITTTGETNESVIVIRAHLVWNGKKIATKNVPNGGAVVFDNLIIDIKAGETEKFLVTVDLEKTNGPLDDGDTIKAELTGTEVDAIEAEDESGEDLRPAHLTGTALGKEHVVYDVGMMVSLVSASATSQRDEPSIPGSADQGTYVIEFKAKSFGGDVYVDRSCDDEDTIGDPGEGVEFEISGGTLVACSLASSTSKSGDTGDTFIIDEGATRTFTLTVIVSGGNNFSSVALESINWGLASDNTNDNNYTFNLGQYRTGVLFLAQY